jgi:hypothetical protein
MREINKVSEILVWKPRGETWEINTVLKSISNKQKRNMQLHWQTFVKMENILGL